MPRSIRTDEPTVEDAPPRPTVLVVEDHLELRNVLLDALDWEGYEVMIARDHHDAMEILRERSVDILVADPPSFDSEISLDQVEDEFPALPVVAFAGQDDPRGVFFGPWTTQGRRRVLQRPFRLRDLLAACRDALDAHPVRSAAPVE